MSSPEASTPLREQVAALSFVELEDRIKSVTQSLASADSQRDALARNKDVLREAIRQREQALLVETGGSLPPDPELDELRAAAQEAKQKLRAMPEELAKLQDVAAALRAEHQHRETQVNNEATALCVEQWRGKSEQYLATARRVIAEAALAYTREHTDDPALVDVPGFVNGIILPLQVQAIFRQMAEKEISDAKQKIKKNDKRLG